MNVLFEREKFTSEKFDVVLLIGQSNAEGYGIGEVENEYEPSENILQLYDSYPVMYRPNSAGIEVLDVPESTTYRIVPAKENSRKGVGKQGCLAMSFIKKYYDKYLSGTDRRLLLVKAAIGGTGFLRNQWTPDGVLYNRALDMADTALSLNPENKPVAILWHQGECESVDGRGRGYDFLYSFYTERLTRLISDLTEKYGEVPFMAGGHCDDWIPRFREESLAITDATKAVISEFKHCGYVETAGLGSNDRIIKGKYLDDVHFNRPALYELGERYFNSYEEILTK